MVKPQTPLISQPFPKQRYPYLAILDFEATCDDFSPPRPQEVIEFPTVLVNSSNGEIVSEFRSYVKPVVHPTLTKFCIQLTGITQPQVDSAPPFHTVLAMHTAWMKQQNLLAQRNSFLFVTCGDWDLKTMMPLQCRTTGLAFPEHFKAWTDIRQIFAKTIIMPPPRQNTNSNTINSSRNQSLRIGMTGMLDKLNLPLVGRHHSGLDDCRNIAAIAKDLLRRGAVFTPTGHVRPP